MKIMNKMQPITKTINIRDVTRDAYINSGQNVSAVFKSDCATGQSKSIAKEKKKHTQIVKNTMFNLGKHTESIQLQKIVFFILKNTRSKL